MKNRRSKWFTVLIVVLMLSLATMGCSSGNNDTNNAANNGGNKAPANDNGKDSGNDSGEIKKVRYVIPGNLANDHDKVQNEVNKRMQADGLNLELEVIAIPWDAWDQRTNIMLQTGEEFELMHVMENRVNSGVYAGRGAIVPVGDLIEEHAPELFDKIPQYIWDAAKVEGEIYSVPALWRSVLGFGGEMGAIGVRQDILNETGESHPTSREELVTTGKKLQDALGGDAYFWTLDYVNPVFLHRDYDTWPFYTDYAEEVIYVDQEGNVKAWFETEEFKKDSEWFRTMYNEGLIHPDVLTVPRDEMNQQLNHGNFLYYSGGIISNAVGIQQNVPEAKLADFKLGAEHGDFLTFAYGNTNAVPTTAKNPEAGIQFLNWLYSSKENHDLFIYGIEGEHFNAIGEDRVERIRDDAGKPLYEFASWQVAHLDYVRYDEKDMDEFVEVAGAGTEDAETSIVLGFRFNVEPVSVEYSNVLAEIKASMYPIKLGVVDYDKNYPTAIQNLKAAGLDKVVAEYEKQFNEWRAKQ